MVTIYDVAKKSGYSITTVSKVLNNYPNVSEKAKEKVEMVVKELGYMPNSSARTLATKKSKMIGVVFSEDSDVGITHPFFSRVFESFKKQVELYNYDMLFVSRNIENNQSYYSHLKNRGVDGVIVVVSESEEVENDLLGSDIPIVFIDALIENTNVVYSDNSFGSMMAVDYLYELGHRKIAHITGKSTLFTAMERIQGFQMAIEKHQLTIPANYSVDGGYFTYEGGRVAMMKLLTLADPPSAVFVSGDEMAIGAIKAVKEAGLRVPEDISIIGFDDISMAKYTDPALTTIRQDTDRIGRQAAVLLLDEIEGDTKNYRSKVIPVSLVKRDSCQPYTKN